MTHPMTKTTIVAALLAVLATGAASAQQRTFYDASGKVIGRSSTDSAGTVTSYDSNGKVISCESTRGNTTTIYDAGGRNVGRFTTDR
jgi:YD repeat-containing protein